MGTRSLSSQLLLQQNLVFGGSSDLTHNEVTDLMCSWWGSGGGMATLYLEGWWFNPQLLRTIYYPSSKTLNLTWNLSGSSGHNGIKQCKSAVSHVIIYLFLLFYRCAHKVEVHLSLNFCN